MHTGKMSEKHSASKITLYTATRRAISANTASREAAISSNVVKKSNGMTHTGNSHEERWPLYHFVKRNNVAST